MLGSFIFVNKAETFDYLSVIEVVNVLLPIFIIVLGKNHLVKRILFALFIATLLMIGTGMWVDYQNKPWFVEQSFNCDGPCYGWYTFENDKNLSWSLPVASAIFGIIILIILELIKTIYKLITKHFIKLGVPNRRA